MFYLTKYQSIISSTLSLKTSWLSEILILNSYLLLIVTHFLTNPNPNKSLRKHD
jgi:hypothetical protein